MGYKMKGPSMYPNYKSNGSGAKGNIPGQQKKGYEGTAYGRATSSPFQMTDDKDIPQPFKLKTDVAVDKIIRAVERKKKVFVFPWQMKFITVPLMKWGPDWLIRIFSM